jgi:ribosomal protein S18 acetylase RimI-like enzyme
MALVRPAVTADADQLVDLIRSAYRGPASRDGWTSEADLVAGDRIAAGAVRGIINGARSMMLVLVAGDEIVACCQLEDRGDKLAYFGTFAVQPNAQGAGLGRRLITEAEREAAVRYEAAAVEMTVLAQQDKLIAWYERLGTAAPARRGHFRPIPFTRGPCARDSILSCCKKRWLIQSDLLR